MKRKDDLILTKEGKKLIEKELKRLVTIERPEVIQEIKTAREQGDLSENAEFDAAREKQGKIEDRISEIENILANSKIIKVHKDEKVVYIGSKVKLLFNNSKVEQEYTIVGSIEANPLKGKISNISPVALAILGKTVGETVLIDKIVKQQKVKIVGITNPE